MLVPRLGGRWLPCLVALVLCLGCGGRRLYPVSGKVVFADGRPLTGGQVVLQPTAPPPEGVEPVSSRGNIRDDGSFFVGTFADTDGAPEGVYKLAVVPPVVNTEAGEKPAIRSKFMRFETSGFELAVTPDAGKNTVTLTVEKP